MKHLPGRHRYPRKLQVREDQCLQCVPRSKPLAQPGADLVPQVTYLYGIVLVVVILTVFVCVCTAREVIRRQARADWQRNLLVIPDPGEDEEEEPKPKMVRPQMFDVYIKEIEHHGLDEYAKCPSGWYGVQVSSMSFILDSWNEFVQPTRCRSPSPHRLFPSKRNEGVI